MQKKKTRSITPSLRPTFAHILSLLHQRDAAWIEPGALTKRIAATQEREAVLTVEYRKMMENETVIEHYRNLKLFGVLHGFA